MELLPLAFSFSTFSTSRVGVVVDEEDSVEINSDDGGSSSSESQTSTEPEDDPTRFILYLIS